MAERTRTGLSAAEAKWAKRVARLEKSGVSVRTFAAREGLKPGSLSFWKWKLAQREGGRSGGARVAALRFVELTTAPPVPSAAATAFEVLLRSGRTVRVPGGFDAAELARLVGVLEEARS